MRDPLARTSFSLLRCSSGRAWDGGVDRDWPVGSAGAGLGGRVVGADDVVPQGFPSGLPGPVGGQVQHRFAGRGGEAGGHVDQVAAQAPGGIGMRPLERAPACLNCCPPPAALPFRLLPPRGPGRHTSVKVWRGVAAPYYSCSTMRCRELERAACCIHTSRATMDYQRAGNPCAGRLARNASRRRGRWWVSPRRRRGATRRARP